MRCQVKFEIPSDGIPSSSAARKGCGAMSERTRSNPRSRRKIISAAMHSSQEATHCSTAASVLSPATAAPSITTPGSFGPGITSTPGSERDMNAAGEPVLTTTSACRASCSSRARAISRAA
jgi:hypothetical protein